MIDQSLYNEARVPRAADLYGDLVPSREISVADYMPGLAVAVAATLAAGYLSDHYHAPLTLMALLIGLALNFLGANQRLVAGLNLASRELLRWGIVLVGARITLVQIVDLGPAALVMIVVIVALTIGAGITVSRLLGFGGAFGTLAGGAVAICGASAAMALATTLGDKRAGQAQLTLVLVAISAMSSLAMFLYPLIVHHLGYGDIQAGFVFGAAVHDVAQALGAGYSFSPHAGDTAAIVKLTRVALLAPVLMAVAIFFPGAERRGLSGIAPPWFVLGFFLFAAMNSLGLIPAMAAGAARDGSTALLACAVAATGIRSPMAALLEQGPRPMIVVASASIVALALALSLAPLVGR